MQPTKRRDGRDGAESEVEPEKRMQKVFQQQLDAFLREIGFEWSDEAKNRWVRGESTSRGASSKASSAPFDRARYVEAMTVLDQIDEDVFGSYLRQAIESVFEESKRAPLNEAPSRADKETLYHHVAKQIWPDDDGRDKVEAVKRRIFALLQKSV